ncbi:unnamed protein product [Owenia fusiformis]|uniref:Uncharacterized protein n=1 Tax=Owenia fusiformis TaxID=6347 RepID=A0A8S4P8G4_OWEFU|nr:unnamed protein product [Owenia fusiformis]
MTHSRRGRRPAEDTTRGPNTPRGSGGWGQDTGGMQQEIQGLQGGMIEMSDSTSSVGSSNEPIQNMPPSQQPLPHMDNYGPGPGDPYPHYGHPQGHNMMPDVPHSAMSLSASTITTQSAS